MYKIISSSIIKRLADGATIPTDPANSDYQDYLAWIDGGNTPTPADVPTPEQVAHTLEVSEAHGIAKAFYASHPAVTSFIRDLTPVQREAQIAAMTNSQLRTVVGYLVEAVILQIKRELLD